MKNLIYGLENYDILYIYYNIYNIYLMENILCICLYCKLFFYYNKI